MWVKTVLQCLETRPRVHTFTSGSSLNNNNIIKSYGNPSTCGRSHSKVPITENIRWNCLYGTKPPQSYSFRSIHWAIPISVTNSPRVRSKITPYDTHQSTLMSPRYSNVTTIICGSIIRYASNNFVIIIFNPLKELQESLQSFYRRM